MAGMWRKTLVYLGLAEEEEDYDEYEPESEGEPDRPLASRRRADAEPRQGARNERDAVVRAMPSESSRVHLVQPTSFDDAQEIGDKFRNGFSVLMNLQSADHDLGRRLVDFASGLAYGLHGSIQPAAEKVFLITPRGVQVSAEERRRVLEERGFFNQA
jgi:cell division inhibitor SepF